MNQNVSVGRQESDRGVERFVIPALKMVAGIGALTLGIETVILIGDLPVVHQMGEGAVEILRSPYNPLRAGSLKAISYLGAAASFAGGSYLIIKGALGLPEK